MIVCSRIISCIVDLEAAVTDGGSDYLRPIVLIAKCGRPCWSGHHASICVKSHVRAEAIIVVVVVCDSPAAYALEDDVIPQAAQAPGARDRRTVPIPMFLQVRYDRVW